ncbi:MAG: glycosyltransferase family 2 protein, partial [Oscillospiraceae bacterium]|nr:glycosyltransferase family 2 protein [Oscillospiraceae bacterium]
MSNTPFFSVIIPVYNVEKYLARCLDSVLSQNFDNFEIIAINDGSSDNSLAVLQEYAEGDWRIKVISKENGGLPAARNSGLYDACGKYVFFLDSDDTMCVDALQKAYDAICEENYPDLLNTGFIKSLYGEILKYDCQYPGDEFFADNLTGDE